jgi:hypothetical protein
MRHPYGVLARLTGTEPWLRVIVGDADAPFGARPTALPLDYLAQICARVMARSA